MRNRVKIPSGGYWNYIEIFFKKIAEFAIILELNGYSGCMEIG